MRYDRETLIQYAKILDRVERGATDAERATAHAIAEKRRRAHPGIHEELLAFMAAEEAHAQSRRVLDHARRQAQAQAPDTALGRLLNRVSSFAFDRLGTFVEAQIDQTAAQAAQALQNPKAPARRKGAPMGTKKKGRKEEEEAEEVETVDWSALEVEEALEDYASVDLDEDDDDEVGPVLAGEVDIPKGLAEYIGEDADRALAAWRWLFALDE